MTKALVKTEVSLGPPNKTPHHFAGGLISIPLAIGLLTPHHALYLVLGGGLYVAWVAGWMAAAVVSTRRFVVANVDAVAALGRGELAKAHAVFLHWASSRHINIRALARHNLGWTLLITGRTEEALAILEDIADCHTKVLRRVGLLPTTQIDIALGHALLGNLDDAERWYALADTKVPRLQTFFAMRAIVRAVIDCRKGQPADAAVSLEHAWTEYEAMATGELLRLIRVIRAFAAATADGPRNTGLVERVLLDLRPRYAGEFSFLGTTWPEMAAFLVAHHLETR